MHPQTHGQTPVESKCVLTELCVFVCVFVCVCQYSSDSYQNTFRKGLKILLIRFSGNKSLKIPSCWIQRRRFKKGIFCTRSKPLKLRPYAYFLITKRAHKTHPDVLTIFRHSRRIQDLIMKKCSLLLSLFEVFMIAKDWFCTGDL
mmetsp:Transcript_5588/g.7434  ORF Transcript_5588/g.7434 Transcript_5588/m.7434 type:complete len:145 (+) Transcript_5588:103-537(+)